jgi:Ribosomal protein S24e
VNVFGLRTQYGGGKTTGFALVYDSPEALKKFEPHYRLVRVGVATKIEKPSRQQRTSQHFVLILVGYSGGCEYDTDVMGNRQATQEQTKDSPRYGKGQGCSQEEGEIDDSLSGMGERWRHWCCWYLGMGFVFVRILIGSPYRA